MIRWPDLARWRGPTPNRGPAMREYRGVVIHIAEGYFEGTISWQMGPDNNVSSHFLGGRVEGERAQIVDLAEAAWTQKDGNGHWLSIEFAGFTKGHPLHKPGWEKLSPAQIEFAAQVLARAHRVFGVPLQLAGSPAGKGLGYHSMGAEHGYTWGHPDCPGEPIKAQLPAILARAIEITNGVEPPMSVLVREKGKPAVFIADGITRRWVKTPDELAAIKATPGLVASTTVREVPSLDPYGLDVATLQAPPATVTMTEADRTAIAEQMAALVKTAVDAIPQTTADLVHEDLAD